MGMNNNRHLKSQFLITAGSLLSLLLLNGCTASHKDTTPKVSPASEKTQNIVSKNIPDLALPQQNSKENFLGSPLTQFITQNFIGSNRCSLCHGHLTDKAGNDMSINNHWQSTMMANAAKDPLWQAKVVSETNRNPAIKKVIEEKCVSCHMPMAWRQFIIDNKGYEAEGKIADHPFEGFLETESNLREAALDGVSCSLCHQIQDINLGIKKSFSGKFTLNSEIQPPDRPIFGPYKETVPEPMQTGIGFTPTYGAHTNDSALCATCHTLYTPYLDGKGNIAGKFPEQTPYLEWLHSEFGEPVGIRHDIHESVGTVRICQECHMPHSNSGGVMIARPAPKEATEKDHFSQHHFVGGNILMLNVLQDNISSLDISASTQKLEDTKMRAAKLLQQESALLSLSKGKISDNTLSTTVTVESLVGHKFPTGFPSRRTWIHLTVQDASGQVFFESGRPQADGGIIGDDCDEKMSYEPHYDLITRQDQVQIYESVMHNTDGQTTFTLLRGAGYIKDNRLLPRGFNKETAHKDIAVQGQALLDKNFIGGSDQVTYSIALHSRKGPFKVTASLHYTPVSHAFMKDLRKDDSLDKVNQFVGFYDEADKTPVTVAAVAAVLQ
ncbi:MAG: hypothetical protein KQH63_21675 [Desulfobulbaceae bacterium]|nr:hypothetical protein [Desulfobulbaceae bacterium]